MLIELDRFLPLFIEAGQLLLSLVVSRSRLFHALAVPIQIGAGQFVPVHVLRGMTVKTLLVVYHTMTGGTEQMAQAAVDGAREESGVHVRLLRAPEAQPEDVLGADGYVFATTGKTDALFCRRCIRFTEIQS